MYIIEGANTISGGVSLGGAKNIALPVLAAACACGGDVRLENMPLSLNDVRVLIDTLRECGFVIEEDGKTVLVRNSAVKTINPVAPPVAGKIRYSLLLLSLLLQHAGKAAIPLPGGCDIGERKFDIHLDSLEKMGAKTRSDDRQISAEAAFLSGARLIFHTATTSGTENVLIAAATAKGKTVIENAHTSPEIVSLINFLVQMGAKITWRTRYIEIEGVPALSGGEFTIPPDRNEAVTFMCLAAMARGRVTLKNFDLGNVREDVLLLRRIGAEVEPSGSGAIADAAGKTLEPFHLCTAPFPGISDMQTLFAALAATVVGESVITDMRFNTRFAYVGEFRKMGIDIYNYENSGIIYGGKRPAGAAVRATDLRAGAALCLLGAIAKGRTEISNVYQIERGYEDFVEKLRALGVDITRIDGS